MGGRLPTKSRTTPSPTPLSHHRLTTPSPGPVPTRRLTSLPPPASPGSAGSESSLSPPAETVPKQQQINTANGEDMKLMNGDLVCVKKTSPPTPATAVDDTKNGVKCSPRQTPLSQLGVSTCLASPPDPDSDIEPPSPSSSEGRSVEQPSDTGIPENPLEDKKL